MSELAKEQKGFVGGRRSTAFGVGAVLLALGAALFGRIVAAIGLALFSMVWLSRIPTAC